MKGGSSYDGMSGKTQIGTWWSGNNGLKTNVEIDNLYIIDKAIQYSPTDQQLCYARAINLNMPQNSECQIASKTKKGVRKNQ